MACLPESLATSDLDIKAGCLVDVSIWKQKIPLLRQNQTSKTSLEHPSLQKDLGCGVASSVTKLFNPSVELGGRMCALKKCMTCF